MKELQVLNNSKTLDSREVAEMMGKKHENLRTKCTNSSK